MRQGGAPNTGTIHEAYLVHPAHLTHYANLTLPPCNW
jgi:hypothetical protein